MSCVSSVVADTATAATSCTNIATDAAQPGTDCNLLWTPLSVLPTGMQDFLMRWVLFRPSREDLPAATVW
jgi:hypothetical protein